MEQQFTHYIFPAKVVDTLRKYLGQFSYDVVADVIKMLETTAKGMVEEMAPPNPTENKENPS